ncbi:MAG: type II secretion system F family protein [Pseudorhodoplanes sp.]|nr:type II secretion system F family protein [Pseudorhodoplanes sp.]
MKQTLALAFLATVAVGGLAWVFLLPILSGERRMEKRRELLALDEPNTPRAARSVQRSRRDQIEQTLKEIEAKQKAAQRFSLPVRIEQAGLTWSKRQFYLIAAGLGVATFLLVMMSGVGLLSAIGLAFAASFGVPFWLLGYLKKRREKQFLNTFPDAVDVIVRGIKAGLPLLDSLKMIAAEGQEPLRTEFKKILETQTIGIPIGDACAKLYERMPLPEANFFGIVISIQQKAGGNLSEALGNLSKVLRDRKKMKAKIQAMSMEAKASAMIIGALPIAVMTLVYITSPSYIELLWTHPTGRLMMAACGVWMLMGCLVMRKMINFDF